MVHIQRNCPYCSTPLAPFTGQHYVQIKSGSTNFAILFQCGICGECIVAKINTTNISGWVEGHTKSPSKEILDSWPRQIEQKAPPYSPDNVASFYLQGTDSLRRKNFDAAGMMFRKSLDAGLRKVHPEGKGTLEKRIDSLPDDLGVTPAMKSWAHNIRDLGNDAAHEEEPFDEGEAKALQSFTELFLTYVFTLPGMIEERKRAKEVS